MNRVLKRPMFRRGGSTDEGITSGLRTGYNRGRVVNPGGYKGDDPLVEHLDVQVPRMLELMDKYAPQRKPSINDFLISTGLDLMSRPKAGGIFQQVAASAKEPYAKLQQQQEARDLMKEQTTRAVVGDLVDYWKDVHSEGEGGRKEFEWESKYQELGERRAERRDLISQMEQIRDETASPAEMAEPGYAQKRQEKMDEIQTKIGIVDNKIRTLDEGVVDAYRKMLVAEGSVSALWEYDQLQKKKHQMKPEEYESEMARILGVESKAEGGRIGYQNAGPVGEGQNVMQGEGSAVQEESPVQQLSFEELRARLPKSITDDIVRLIADSEQALVDFSSIRTQQDIDSFNQKYGVDLVMPPEV